MSETFVDTETAPLPPQHLWSTLSSKELIDAKNNLLNKIFMARGKPAYLGPLNQALSKLEGILAIKLSENN